MEAFPEGFLWGVSTSAFQIEGSPLADGAGLSNWDRFCHEGGLAPHLAPGGDFACDHYRRWREDIALMKDLGFQSYRFSVAWTRVLPGGKGQVNARGLDFYGRLVDGLLEAGIRPMITLYHWDLPAALEDLGGWLNPDVAGWFSDYAHIVAGALSDRVETWATLNEPWVIMDEGHLRGTHPPGRRNAEDLPVVARNLLLAHGRGVQACRAGGARQVGLVVNLEPKYAHSGSPEDEAATRRADAYMNRQFLDPVLLGRHPRELEEVYPGYHPEDPEADLRLIQQPLDYVGINYYSRNLVRHDPQGPLGQWSSVPHPTNPRTDMDWEVYPQALTELLVDFKARYGDIPILINENGGAFPDPDTAPAGGVQDPLRVDYFRRHLQALREAIGQGVDVRGYSAWSLLDNFEWGFGYTKRFGIVHVDYRTQVRTPKASARFLGEVIRSNGSAI